MKILYADDTYARASREDRHRPIHMFGGVVVSREAETEIIARIRAVKDEYTHPNLPIKWNFKDSSIRKKYAEFKRDDEYRAMLSHSREWRLKIFESVSDLDFSIIVSCIEARSRSRKALREIKNALNTYCFENVLMRAGLDAQEAGGHWQCVLDWPPDGDSRPFDRGYYQLFHFGQGASSKPCLCGPLEGVGFSHSLHFTRCNHSPMMQFTDLVIGATRDHIECRLQDRDSCVGTEAVDLFYDHYRNLNGKVPRYGVVTSTGSTKLSEHVNQIFARKANKTNGH